MSKYNSDSIRTLSFPDSIRFNPSMYIGGTDSHGLFVVLRELLDNAADEYLAGRNNYLGVFIADGAFWVQDAGSGIPQGTKTLEVQVDGKTVTSRMPTMQSVFGVLHTSGKFQSEAYKVSIGSHGVGVKGTNATSLYFNVWTVYSGKCYSVAFEKGKLTGTVSVSKPPISPFTGKPLTKGTLITFKPDPSIFTVKTFPPSMLLEWAEVMSYLSPGFKIQLKSNKGMKTFLSQKGPRDYIDARLKALAAESEPTVFEFTNELATVAVAFSNADGCLVRGYTNGLHNSQGGKHVDSVVAGLFKALKPFAGVKQVFTVHDLKDGLVGLVNAKLHKAQFSSQDKAKLSDDRMGATFEAAVTAEAEKFFKSNKAMAARICDRAFRIAELKNKFKNNKAVASALGKLKRSGLPPNYAPAHKSVLMKDRELILVEGASAAGPIREVRGKHQALLPLKGKIMNVAKSKAEKALQSRDILNILAAIGFDPKAEDPLSKLQVGRIICLADPDPDGHHINCLLLTLFTKYLPGMFERGMVYVADTPEFYALHKGQVFTGDRLSQVQAKLAKAKVRADVHHVKGWGEVDAQVVKLWAVDPATRRLVKITPLSTSDMEQFGKLMGASMEVNSEA